MGCRRPRKRPADRVYAETRGTDPEGNNFDLSEAGFDRDIAPEKKEPKNRFRPEHAMRTFFRALVAVAVLASAAPGQAQPIGDLFKGGKQLRFVLGASPGQDYDVWARLIGRHLSRHLPGSPVVVVQNMPGAGHMLATNWLYNVAPRDGTVWGMVSRNIPNAAFQNFSGVRYDPIKFNWIGSPEINNRGCFAMDRAR